MDLYNMALFTAVCAASLFSISNGYVDESYGGETDCLYDFSLDTSWSKNGVFRAKSHLCRSGTACLVYKNDFLGYTGAPECIPLDSPAFARCNGDPGVASKNCTSLTQWGNCCCVGHRCNYPDFDTISKVRGIDRLEWRGMMSWMKLQGIHQPDVDQVVRRVMAKRRRALQRL